MLYSDNIISITQAIEMENNGEIIIYHSGRTLSSLDDLPQCSIWRKNWKKLTSKYRKVPLHSFFDFIDFDYMIEYKFEEGVDPSMTNWVYMYAKSMVGQIQLDELHSRGKYIYILTNEAYPEYCKIGRAITPSKRIKQINGAGTVSEWKLRYALPVTDDVKVESIIHQKLVLLRRDSHQGSKREFFEIGFREAVQNIELLGEPFRTSKPIYY